MNTDTRYADVNGIRIAYERDGSGYPLLLLHGYPETRRMWRVVASALTERFDVVNMDLRGYGESERRRTPTHATSAQWAKTRSRWHGAWDGSASS